MAVSNKTYNNVVNFLCRLGEYHEQIATVSVGDIFDIDMNKNTKFVLMHINPTGVTTGDSELIYNFQIFVCDMTNEKKDWKTKQQSNLTKLVNTKTNEQEVFNQTLEISTDLISMMRHSAQQSLQGTNDINEPLYFTEDQFSLDPFQERFDNLLCGWVWTVGIKVINNFDACAVPLSTTNGAGY
jgi:hypothetical protein